MRSPLIVYGPEARLQVIAPRILPEIRLLPGTAFNQIGSLIGIFFTSQPGRDYESAVLADTARCADYFGYLLDHGIYAAPSQFEAMFLSDAQTDEDIAYTCQVIRDYFKQEKERNA